MDVEDAHAALTPLSPQEHSCLMVTDDWKSPLEVAQAIYGAHVIMSRRKKVAQALCRLHEIGLLKYGAPNNTYRRTGAGNVRAANETATS